MSRCCWLADRGHGPWCVTQDGTQRRRDAERDADIYDDGAPDLEPEDTNPNIDVTSAWRGGLYS